MKKRIRQSALLMALFCLLSTSASASIAYDGYTYNAWDEAVPSPVGYETKDVYAGQDLSDIALKTPSDIYVDSNGTLYLSDTGNNRILVLNTDLELEKTIDTIYHEDGTSEPLNKPAGIHVDENGNLFIAQPDTGTAELENGLEADGRVLMLDKDGHLLSVFTRPDSELMPDNISFKPSRVLVNQLGTVFVIIDNLYLGAITYNMDGDFLSFYGAADVDVTLELLVDYMWKQFMTQEQINAMARYVPTQYTSFDVDSENFIYTCSKSTSNSLNEIRKLNALGNDVLLAATHNVSSSTGNYGDLETGWFMGSVIDTQFVDIYVSENNLIFGLDTARGRIFEYDQEGRLLNIFGTLGEQEGSFESPCAIDGFEDRVYVLDKAKNTLTLFTPTTYGSLIEEATQLYNDGLYQEAKVIWEQVLELNVNCELAYTGIGKALYENGEYRQAMTYLKLGYDRDAYSQAFQDYRMGVIRQYAPYVLSGILLLVILLWIFLLIRRRVLRKKEGKR